MRNTFICLPALMAAFGVLFCSCGGDGIEEPGIPGSVNSYDVNTDYQKLLNAYNGNAIENISYKDKVIVDLVSRQKKISGKGQVSVTYSVIPLYVHQAEEKASGEYYIVDATVSIASKDMYTPPTSFKFDNSNKSYTYCGLYLKGFDVQATLKRTDGAAESVSFDRFPAPETTISSTTYTSGVTWGINGVVSGGEKGVGGTVEASFSYTSSKTRNISDLTINNYCERTGLVSYKVSVNNLPQRASEAAPAISHSTLDFHFSWVWYLPNVKANDEKTRYVMNLSVANLTYEGIGSFNQTKVTEVFPSIQKELKLPVPNRILSGSVDIENDTEKLMSDIIYTNLETKIAYPDITTSAYGEGMRYKRELPIGKYSLSFKLDGKECKSDESEPVEVRTARNMRIYSGYYD